MFLIQEIQDSYGGQGNAGVFFRGVNGVRPHIEQRELTYKCSVEIGVIG